MGSLDGKVALVSGASSGIGEATALALAGEGARVGLAARRVDRLESLARKLGDAAMVLECDVSDAGACRAAVARVRDDLGGLDVVVNNAGVMLLGPILDADLADWRQMVEVNLLGLMYLTHAALPGLVAQGSGDIVNVSSVAGRVARAGAGVYNATKFGVGAFSESLRQEVTGRGVRVTLVEPGAVATELTSHITHDQTKDAIEQWVSSMRPLQSEDIAAAVLYAVTQPAHVSVNELTVRPTDQER